MAEEAAETVVAEAPAQAAPAPKASAKAVPAKAEAAPAETSDTSSDYDWRGKLAGEDAKFRKELDRFTDEGSFAKAYKEVRSKATDPRRVAIPGDDATDDDRAAYAKARGIPETPDKYEIKAKPPQGYEPNDTDKERLTDITAFLHSKGGVYADPAVINAAHELYYREAETAVAYAVATAARQAELTNEELGKLWPGAEKARNIGFAKVAVAHYFGNEWSEIADMQLATGALLGDSAPFIKAWAKVGRETMEDPIFLEAGRNGADASKSIQSELDGLLSLRATNRSKYNSPETQKRLAELYDAKQRHEDRSASH